jgi:Mg2+ and Co2+ transporter CorA
MANVISLSFNLVTQQDSRIMQDDSNAMKAIAVLTLIFLPATGISSVFSMPFFEEEGERPGRRVLRIETK